MAFPDLVAPYQWNFRPQRPRRPAWFTEWPGGARMAVTLILLHEWESTPTIARPMPKGAHHTFDSLALGGREYGARFGVWRLLGVLERHEGKATVVTSGRVGELFPASVREGNARGRGLATQGWGDGGRPTVCKAMD